MLHTKKVTTLVTLSLLLSSVWCTTATTAATQRTYVPAQGPLTLGDSWSPAFPGGHMTLQRGLIMKAIINEPEFFTQRAIISYYTNTNPQHFPTYQDIVESLKTSINNDASIQVIKAFEKVIMKLVHYENYIYYTEGRWTNMFFAGIQKPSMSWLTLSTSADITQLMEELKQLAQIAKRHSLSLSFRLKNKADSYLYWKTRMLKAIAAVALAGGAYYYRDNLRNAAHSIYITSNDLAKSAYSTGANLITAGANLAGSTYNTGVDLASSLYNTSANLVGSVYNTGANVVNSTAAIGSSVYSTGADWTRYLGSYIPSYSSK